MSVHPCVCLFVIISFARYAYLSMLSISVYYSAHLPKGCVSVSQSASLFVDMKSMRLLIDKSVQKFTCLSPFLSVHLLVC